MLTTSFLAKNQDISDSGVIIPEHNLAQDRLA